MFRNAKVGDRVFEFRKGWGTIFEIKPDDTYPICVQFDDGGFSSDIYTYDGKGFFEDKNPTLFWNEIKFEIPKKPFELKGFLKENLEPKEFSNELSRDCIGIRGKNFKILTSKENVIDTVYFKNVEYEKIEKIEDTLNKNKITLEQLKQAFKELGWL